MGAKEEILDRLELAASRLIVDGPSSTRTGHLHSWKAAVHCPTFDAPA
jgi:hypothetical protein